MGLHICNPRLPGDSACGEMCPRPCVTPASTWLPPLEAWSPRPPSTRPRGSPAALPRCLPCEAGWLRVPVACCALASPVDERRTEACAQELPGGGRAAPLETCNPPPSPAKSLKASSPFVTPGASNHSVSISLTLFIPLKTHLKTLQPGVCSGLYPH